jgi:adenosylcobinamide-phosphate synthase
VTRRALAGALLLGTIVDELVGDPVRAHPVAGFGCFATALERRLYADSRWAGTGFALAALSPVIAGGRLIDHRTRRRPIVNGLLTAVAIWVSLGGRSLRAAGVAMADALALEPGSAAPCARLVLPTLCGRDPAALDAAGLTRATVESLAENTSDAIVGPLVWAAIAGLPGVLGYRAVNTLDAMVGHRSARYARFGTGAARLDDLANLVGARLTAALAVLLAPTVQGSRREAWSSWRWDAGAHPSPNAGPCEAAFAGALGVQLGGQTHYATHSEARPTLGRGRAPGAADIGRAVRLSRHIQWTAVALVLLGRLVVRGRPSPGRPGVG